MQDRVSKYPGRVKLTPVSGQTNVYDMVIMDEPTTEGTKLNKANILTDATASLIGLTAAATPNDAFAKLRSLITTAQNTADSAPKIIASTYTGNGIGSGSPDYKTINTNFPPQAVFVMKQFPHYSNYNEVSMGFATSSSPLIIRRSETDPIYAIEIVNNGFKVANYVGDTMAEYVFNNKGDIYNYLAIG